MFVAILKVSSLSSLGLLFIAQAEEMTKSMKWLSIPVVVLASMQLNHVASTRKHYWSIHSCGKLHNLR